jgi:hypothetical protein
MYIGMVPRLPDGCIPKTPSLGTFLKSMRTCIHMYLTYVYMRWHSGIASISATVRIPFLCKVVRQNPDEFILIARVGMY